MQSPLQKPPGCFSRFGCFSVFVVIVGMLVCLWGWQHTDPRNLPQVPLPPSLPSLFSHSLMLSNQPARTVPLTNQPTGNFRVVGKPTISADFINQVLAFYHSPAAGLGQALYDDGVRSGIDPVFALAFFMHESLFGTQGVATVTHSLGNLRCISNGPCFDGYASFASWPQGFEAWYQLIHMRYVAHRLVTVDEIIPVYAPAQDGNNVASYIAAVSQAADRWRSGQIASTVGKEEVM